MLENLFRNAIAHGQPDPGADGDSTRGIEETVTITVEVFRDENGTGVGFAVADDGTGIPDSERDSVFEAGFTTSSEGTGFGLAIVRSIADAHGWTIELARRECGARFEVTGVDFH